MKTIYNSLSEKRIWTGEEYLVDGQPGPVSPPLHLLDVVDGDVPTHDPATQKLERVVGADVDNKTWGASYSVRELTAEEIEARKPTSATPERFWLALYELTGLTEETVAQSIAGDTPALIRMRKAPTILRHDPLFLNLMTMLGKTDAEADAVFAQANNPL